MQEEDSGINIEILDLYEGDLKLCHSLNDSQEIWLCIAIAGGKYIKKSINSNSDEDFENLIIKLFNRVSKTAKYLDQHVYRLGGKTLSWEDIFLLLVDETIIAKKEILFTRVSFLTKLIDILPESSHTEIFNLVTFFYLMPRHTLKLYRQELRANRKLPSIVQLLRSYNPRESTNLIKSIQHRSKTARDLLIRSQLPYVKWFAYGFRNFGLDYLDLIQEGNIGLITAINKFDIAHNTKLKTYSRWWIKQRIMRAIANSSRVIRLPVHLHEKVIKARKEYLRYLKDENSEPTSKDLAELLEMSVGKVDRLIYFLYPVLSLEVIIECEDNICNHMNSLDDNGRDNHCPKCVWVNRISQSIDPFSLPMEWHEHLCSLENSDNATQNQDRLSAGLNHLADSSICESLDNKIFRDQMWDLLMNTLSERELSVLELRFGFNNKDANTLQEIADIYDITRERVRQIESRAIDKLESKIKL